MTKCPSLHFKLDQNMIHLKPSIMQSIKIPQAKSHKAILTIIYLDEAEYLSNLRK